MGINLTDHTFNGVATGSRAGIAAFEPGAGSTIMGYAGNCGADDLQANSDASSIPTASRRQLTSLRMAKELLRHFGEFWQCVKCRRRPDYTVPAETALVLDGSGSDSDDDSLTYLWEQRDLNAAGALSAADDGSIPLFRFSLRYRAQTLPAKLEKVVSGVIIRRRFPSIRTMDFTLTARDSQGGVTSTPCRLRWLQRI